MRGLGDFQNGKMKQRDDRISALCQHLRSAIYLFEQIASQPYQPPVAVEAEDSRQAVSSPPLNVSRTMPPGKVAYSIDVHP